METSLSFQKKYFLTRFVIVLGMSLSIIGCSKDETETPGLASAPPTPTLPTLSPITSNSGAGVTDVEGNTYSTVALGNGQEWMAENLTTTKFSNGDAIPTEIGDITSISIAFPGVGYKKNSVFNNIPLLGGNGTGATADITIDSTGKAINVTLINVGNGYWTDDILVVKDSLLSDTAIGCCLQIKVVSTPWQNLTTAAWSHYNFDNQYENPYGKLYNYFTVADARNVCPTGWHIPTESDWNTLVTYLDPSADVTSATPTTPTQQSTTAGGRMKSMGKQYWQAPNTYATNESGFSAVPGGSRSALGKSFYLNISAAFWSSTTYDANNTHARDLSTGSGFVYGRTLGNTTGLSIRCIKD